MQINKSFFNWIEAKDIPVDPIKMGCLQRMRDLSQHKEINQIHLGSKIAVLQASIPKQDAKLTLEEARRNVFQLPPNSQEDAWLRIAKAQRIIEPKEVEGTLKKAEADHTWDLNPHLDAEFLCKKAKFYLQTDPEKAKSLLEKAQKSAVKSRHVFQGVLKKFRIIILLRPLDPRNAYTQLCDVQNDVFKIRDKELQVKVLAEIAKLQFSEAYLDLKSNAKETLELARRIAEKIHWDSNVKVEALKDICLASIQVDISEALKLAKILEDDKLYSEIAKAQAVNNLDDALSTINLIKNDYYKVRTSVGIAALFSKIDHTKAQELVNEALNNGAAENAEFLCDLARIQKQIDPEKYQAMAQLALNALDKVSIFHQFSYLKRLAKA